MKLKLVAKGYETFTGMFGGCDFIDGESVTDVTESMAKRISCIIHCEWENGDNPSVAQSILNNQNVPAENFLHDSSAPVTAASKVVEGLPQTQSDIYTEEDLGVIADKEGIAGLRLIADANGIKGNSIAALVKQIVAANIKKA